MHHGIFATAMTLVACAANAQNHLQFYLMEGDGQLYRGNFGTNSASFVGNTGLAPSPGSGSGLASELAFDQLGRLYGLGGTPQDNNSRLARIDTNTAQATTVADTEAFGLNALTFGSDGLAYVYENEISDQFITRIDPNTGNIASRVVDPPAGSPILTSWTFRSDGALIASGFNRNALYEVDPIAGTVSEILPFSLGGVNAFASHNGVTYAGIDNGSSYDVFTVNLFNGESKFFASLTGDHVDAAGNVFGFAVIPAPSGAAALIAGVGMAARRRRIN